VTVCAIGEFTINAPLRRIARRYSSAPIRDRFVSEFIALCLGSHPSSKELMSNGFQRYEMRKSPNRVGLQKVYSLRRSYKFQK